jgi:hypothetical protein
VPETFLTKICIVSSASEAQELMLEMLAERRMVVVEAITGCVVEWQAMTVAIRRDGDSGVEERGDEVGSRGVVCVGAAGAAMRLIRRAGSASD